MKPHRRKKTPPRREHASEERSHPAEGPQPVSPQSQGSPPAMSSDPATYGVPEQPYVDPGEMAYDAGQALTEEPASPYAELEPSQNYSESAPQASDTTYEAYVEPPADPYPNPSHQGYVDPNQAYVDPNPQAYVDPNQQAYVDPNQQAYVDPNQQAYVDPNQQAYVDPNQQAYVDPNQQAYVDPNQQAYVDPNQQAYVDPGPVSPEPPPAPPEPAADAGIYDEAPQAHTRKARPRKKLTKKKGPLRSPAGGPPVRPTGRPSGRPPVGAGAPGAYSKPLSKSGGGISVMTVFLSLSALVMFVIVLCVILPKNMKHISGYPASPSVEGEARNLLDEGQKLVISRKGELSLSEEDVNQYLNDRLQGRQGGVMGIFVKFEGVYIDFSPGFAEVIVQRKFLGIPITMSAKIKGEKFRRQMLYKPAGWSIGKVQFKSRNIKPVIEMFHRLRETMEEEYQVIQLMTTVRFEQDRLVLDPSKGS